MRTPRSDTRDVLRWQFGRGPQVVTCGVAAGPASYDVITVPYWNLSGAAVETFKNPAAAFRRHASIASRLRDTGWRLTSYTP